MRAGQGTPQNKHLETIEPDQSIQGIEQIDDTIRNDAGRKFFVSQAIQPTIPQGWYNPETGRYVLGPPDYFEIGVAFSTASVASLSLTCPTGYAYEVYYAGAVNITQSSEVTLRGTLDGNALAIPIAYGVTAYQTVLNGCLGISQSGNTDMGFIPKTIWLEAGDILTVQNETFAAGNDTEYLILYKAYRR